MGSKRTIHAALAACALIGSAWLTRAVLSGKTLGFDLLVRARIHDAANPAATAALKGITHLGAPWWIATVTTLAAFMMYRKGFRRDAILLGFVVAGAFLFNEELKLLVRRPRPDPFFYVIRPSSFSFPSGHALFSSSLYGTMAYIASRRGISGVKKAAVWASALWLIALVCLSRIYLGVHYPADVAGGVLMACCWVNAVMACAKLP